MTKRQKRDREYAIKSYLKGESITAIAMKLGYSQRWVYKWIQRYKENGEESDWQEDKTRRPHSNPRQLPDLVIEAVKQARASLIAEGLFCGAQAIRWELEAVRCEPLPSLRTISRIISREGMTVRRTGRYEPKGKAYPVLIGQHANDVHQSDYVGPCYLSGALRFYSINSVDLATGRCAVTPLFNKASQSVIDSFWSNWWRLGIPKHQQIDNELVFYGANRYPRGMGCLIRLCLATGVEPWFIPLAEPWRNGVVEKFNDHYRRGFLRRVFVEGVDDLLRESLVFETKHNTRYRYTKLKGRTTQMALGNTKSDCPIHPKHRNTHCPNPKRVAITWSGSFAAMLC